MTDSTAATDENRSNANVGQERVVMRLCYVSGPFAYFTSKELSEQWGDDWNDAPYEHNAGEPYAPCWHNTPHGLKNEMRGCREGTAVRIMPGELCRNSCCAGDWNDDGTPKFEIKKIAFECDLETPEERTSSANSQYSVEMINSGAIAWLSSPSYAKVKVAIQAGATMEEFVSKIKMTGGSVYFPA